MSSDYPPDWNSKRKNVYQRDNQECQNCGVSGGQHGRAELHAHHIVPKSRGGTHEKSNLITLCKDCHNTVHSKSKQAPTRESQNTITRVDYAELSDEIIDDLSIVLNEGLESIEAILLTDSNYSITDQAGEITVLATEYRQYILTITRKISQLSDSTSRQYPPDMIRVNEKPIHIGENGLSKMLETFEYGEETLWEMSDKLASCPKCKEKLRLEDKFCGSCGIEINLIPSCPDCDARIQTSDDFCTSCGTNIVEIKDDDHAIGSELENIEENFAERIEEIIDYLNDFVDSIEARDKAIEELY